MVRTAEFIVFGRLPGFIKFGLLLPARPMLGDCPNFITDAFDPTICDFCPEVSILLSAVLSSILIPFGFVDRGVENCWLNGGSEVRLSSVIL